MLIYDSTLPNAKKTCPVEKKLTRLVKKSVWQLGKFPFCHLNNTQEAIFFLPGDTFMSDDL